MPEKRDLRSLIAAVLAALDEYPNLGSGSGTDGRHRLVGGHPLYDAMLPLRDLLSPGLEKAWLSTKRISKRATALENEVHQSTLEFRDEFAKWTRAMGMRFDQNERSGPNADRIVHASPEIVISTGSALADPSIIEAWKQEVDPILVVKAAKRLARIIRRCAPIRGCSDPFPKRNAASQAAGNELSRAADELGLRLDVTRSIFRSPWPYPMHLQRIGARQPHTVKTELLRIWDVYYRSFSRWREHRPETAAEVDPHDLNALEVAVEAIEVFLAESDIKGPIVLSGYDMSTTAVCVWIDQKLRELSSHRSEQPLGTSGEAHMPIAKTGEFASKIIRLHPPDPLWLMKQEFVNLIACDCSIDIQIEFARLFPYSELKMVQDLRLAMKWVDARLSGKPMSPNGNPSADSRSLETTGTANTPAVVPTLPVGQAGDKYPKSTKKKKRGRKMDSDPKQDQRIVAAWESKRYANLNELANAERIPKSEVIKAIDRQRKRRNKSAN